MTNFLSCVTILSYSEYSVQTGDVYLCHFIALSLPTESFVVKRVIVGPDKDRLPVYKAASPLANVKHVQVLCLRCFLPFLTLRHVMTAGA